MQLLLILIYIFVMFLALSLCTIAHRRIVGKILQFKM